MTLGVLHSYFLDVVSFEFFGSKPSSDRSNYTHCMYLCVEGIDEVCGSYRSFHIYERLKPYECTSLCFVSRRCSCSLPADRASYFLPSFNTYFSAWTIGFPNSSLRRPSYGVLAILLSTPLSVRLIHFP